MFQNQQNVPPNQQIGFSSNQIASKGAGSIGKNLARSDNLTKSINDLIRKKFMNLNTDFKMVSAIRELQNELVFLISQISQGGQKLTLCVLDLKSVGSKSLKESDLRTYPLCY